MKSFRGKVAVITGAASGMGRELAQAFAPAREVFEAVDETLKQNLTRLMFEGPAEELTLTANAQPALMAVSMAVVRVLEAQGYKVWEKAAFVAGHSLGEYSAHAAAGTFTIADAARLLRVRGNAMQAAVPAGAAAVRRAAHEVPRRSGAHEIG